MSLTGNPTPQQVLEGIRSSLRNEVLPALQGEQAAVARNRLTMALTMLAWVAAHWDGSAALLVEEIQALEALLGESDAPLEDAGFGEAAARMREIVGDKRGSLLLSDLIKRSDALQEGLLDLARIVTSDGCPQPLSSLRERVCAELTAFNRRRLA